MRRRAWVAGVALVGWAPGGGRRCGQSDIRGLGTAWPCFGGGLRGL